MPDPLATPLWAGLRFVSPLVLLWLAFFFGRTLRRGATPLIEQIARRSTPALSAPLCRYTRRLTAVWCAWFVVAAVVAAFTGTAGAAGYAWHSLVVSGGTALLFIGERGLRPLLFPGEVFPGLRQQLRDTWTLWRPDHRRHRDTPR